MMPESGFNFTITLVVVGVVGGGGGRKELHSASLSSSGEACVPWSQLARVTVNYGHRVETYSSPAAALVRWGEGEGGTASPQGRFPVPHET